jgi:Protein of unknown function (DUF1559)
MSRILTLTFLTVLTVPTWADEDRKDSDTLARAVAPYIHDRTTSVVHLDLARLDLEAFVRWIEEQKLEPPQRHSPVRQLAGLVKPLRRAGVQNVCLLLDLDQDIFELPPLVITLESKSSMKEVATVLRGLLMMAKNIQLEEHDRYLVVAGTNTLQRLRQVKRVERPEVAKVLGSRERGVHHVLFFPPDDLRRAFDEMISELPPVIGGGPSRPLTHGLLWLALGVDLPPKPRLSLTVQAADAHSATALKGIIGRGIPLWADSHHLRQNWPGMGKVLSRFQLRVEGDRLTWGLGSDEGNALLVETLRQVRDHFEEVEAANQFHQILIALHNYHDVHKSFPPAVFTDKAGKPLLSWRVYILPFLDENDLFKQFHLHEPWDSEHNKKLIARMPKVFASPEHPELARQGKTAYLVPVGKDTAFPGTTAIRIRDLTDGTSNTIALVDAAADRAVIWTKPDDLPIDLDNPSKGLSQSMRKKYMVGMGDGSVRLLNNDISKTTLRAAFTRAGGEPLGPDW